MSEPSKMPYEPISMPGLPAMPAIPEMPSMPDMPRPSYSRTSTPPTPIQRKPFMIAEDHLDTSDKPNPFLLPPGIAPEAPASQLPPAPPVPASSGFPLSWLKPSRAKGVVFAGLASLAIGAFGLNALFPTKVHEPKADDLTVTKPMAAATKPALPPKVIEERPAAVEPPALLPREIVVQAETDPWNKTPIKLVDNATPAPVTVPMVPPALPIPTEPLPVPLTVPGPLPVPAVIPVVPVVPMTGTELPPVKIDALPPVDLTPKPTPLPPVAVTPIEVPKVVPIETLPVPSLTPEPKLTPTPIPVVPVTPEIKPEPKLLPLPVPIEKPPATVPVSVDAKTDYDVDIHKLKSGDTYAAISEKFYGTANYAGAIRAYNDGLELARLRDVQVPPIHIIKRFGAGAAPIDTPRVLPVGVLQDPGLVTPPPIERDIQWGTPGSRKTDKPADGGVNWR